MDILIFCPTLKIDSLNRASSIHMANLLKYLPLYQDGKITIICDISSKNSGFCLNANSINFMNTNLINTNFLKDLIISIIGFFVAYHQCVEEKPDIIYCRYGPYSLLSLIISKIFHIASVIEVNGLATEELELIGLSSVRRKITYASSWACLKVLSTCDQIIAVTPWIKRKLLEDITIKGKEISVIRNGADINLFKPLDGSKCKRYLKFHEDFYHICFVGKFFIYQGIEYLIRAISIIPEEIYQVKFLIIGDGPRESEVKKLSEVLEIGNRALFLGRVSYENVPIYINSSDICVVPKIPLISGYSPLKLYEYMACGKPVIASDLPGFKILKDKKAGALVDPQNPKDIADSIIMLLKEEKRRRKMGKNGRKISRRYHSWESVAEKLVKCFGTVLTR